MEEVVWSKKKKKLMKGVEKLIIGVKWELEVSALLSSCVVRNARVEVHFFPHSRLFFFMAYHIRNSMSH